MCPSLIEIGSKTAEKNSAQQTNRHYENNGHLAVNQHRQLTRWAIQPVINLSISFITLLSSTYLQHSEDRYTLSALS